MGVGIDLSRKAIAAMLVSWRKPDFVQYFKNAIKIFRNIAFCLVFLIISQLYSFCSIFLSVCDLFFFLGGWHKSFFESKLRTPTFSLDVGFGYSPRARLATLNSC